MDYEKEYKEALERAREYHKVDTDNTLKLCAKGTMEYLFPVLKESNDEKIRKTLLGYFKDQDAQYTFRGLTNNEVITWLEKVIIPNYNDIDSSFIKDIKEVIADAPLLMQSDKEKMIAWLEKQDKENIIESLRLEYERGKAYALQEQRKEWTAEDLLNRNQIADILQEYNRGDLIKWLEKQGEQKLARSKGDEKMRNVAINACKYMIDNFENSTKQYEDAITWLEKQDVSNKVSIWKHWKDGIAGNGDGKQMFLIKSYNTYNLSSCLSFECDYIELSELEKLMEKKDESKFEQCIQEGDEIVTNEDGTHFNISQLERTVKKVTESKEAVKEFLKKAGIMDKNGELADEYKPEKQGGNSVTITKCNNSITNAEVVSHPTVTVSTTIEPKFKVGDYLVNDYCKGKVIELTDDAYLLDTEQGIPFSCEHNAHLWTIQDAKDGDVLQLGKVTAIFKEFIGNNCKCYCSVYKGELEIPADDGFDNVYGCYDTHPATKEQRDLLFQKMHEAGYEWDSEKKELMKIEPKPAMEIKTPEESLGIDSATYNNIVDECIYGEQKPNWSEEDEEMFKLALKYLKQSYYSEESVVSWFNSLKNRVNPQPQKEWSEEDEENLNQLHKLIVKKAYEEYEIDTEDETLWGKYAILDNWLKTLKDRVQLHWKPSEEQMKGIDCAIKTLRHQLNVEDKRLNSLYKQLKKL